MQINPNHFQSNDHSTPHLTSLFTGQLYPREYHPPTYNTIHIVVGPIRCGKSTYINQHAMPGDMIISHSTPLTIESLQGIRGKTIWKEHDSYEFQTSPSHHYQDLILRNHLYIHKLDPYNKVVDIYRNTTYIKTINFPVINEQYISQYR